MYLSYYGLKKEPFHTTPDPSFLFLSPQHKEALGAIIYGIEKRKGFIAIIGEVGVGKTTILRAYLERKASKRQKIVYIFNPVLSYHGLLTAIFRSLEIVPRNDDVTEMVNQLHEALIVEYQAGGTVVLAIDEAQNMPMETLENLRMISNLESSTDKLIQIILLGQPELNSMLEQPALRQFRQRIALRATISALSSEESRAFIEHRIKVASNFETPILFTKGALNLIVKQAQGIPRRLNILCDNALITGFGRQCKLVPVSVVREVIKDIDGKEGFSFSPYFRWAVGIGAAIFFIAVAFFFFDAFPFNTSKIGINPSANQINEPTGMHAISKTTSPKVSNQPPKNQNIISPVEFSPNQDIARSEKSGTLQENETIQISAVQPSPIDKKERTSQQNIETELAYPLKHTTSQSDLSASNNNLLEENVGSNPIKSDIYTKAQTNSKPKVARTVKPGENLSLIAVETYGSQNPEYIDWVKKHNPHIVNPNVILPGQHIMLPEYKKSRISE